MKKPKRSSPYEDNLDPMRDLDVEIESSGDDDDIIDLEDIIEMPDSSIDEDEDLDLGAEILDVDSDLEPAPEKAAQPPMKEQPRDLGSEEEDLIQLVGDESEEDEIVFEPAASRELGKPSMGGGKPQIFDEDVESLLDEFVDEPSMSETMMRAEEKVDLKAGAAASVNIPKETPISDVEPEAAISGESVEATPAADASSISAATPPAVDLSQTAEELIGRIESRLQEHIRVVVESRLPDLVRSIIHEEVERLRKELD
jgi:hypothetical protein